MQHALAIIIVSFLLFIVMAGVLSPFWIRGKQTRTFLADVFKWIIFGAGIILGSLIIWRWIDASYGGREESNSLLLPALFSIIMIGAGSTIFFELIIRRRMGAIIAKKLKLQYPDEPWRWTGRWQTNRITYSDKSEMITSYLIVVLIATFLGIISTVKTEAISEGFREKGLDSVCLIYAVVMSAVFSVQYALRSTVRWRKSKTAFFDMSVFPAEIGNKLEGEILTKSLRVPRDGFELKLSCIEFDISFKKSFYSIRENILWESNKNIRIEDIRMGPYGISFPVVFHIPENAAETDTISRDTRISWVLTAKASGDDDLCLNAVFKVPVFRIPKKQNYE